MADTPKAPPLADHLYARAEAMRNTFQRVRRAHKGESGRRREDDLRDFLRLMLPGRLGVGTGEIVATDGTVSGQADIIIYDALQTPLLDRSESSIVVPIEGVYGVIEVSSRLDGPKLKEDVAKIRAIKRLPKTAYFQPSPQQAIVNTYSVHGQARTEFPTLGFCFAYESVSLRSLLKTLDELDDTEDLANNVDMVCSLSVGCIANGERYADGDFGRLTGARQPGLSRFGLPTKAGDRQRGEGAALLLFYLIGCGLLTQADTKPIRMAAYMGEIPPAGEESQPAPA